MGYLIYGNFSARLRRDFLEDLDEVRVKIYRSDKAVKSISKETADKKYPMKILDVAEIAAKRVLLIGEGSTDASGNYRIELLPEYQEGDPVEINMEVHKVPNQKSTIDKTIQFIITTLQPVWRTEGNNLSYNWNYCLPGRFWCGIRGRFDMWTVFGSVRSSSDGKTPKAGVTVIAFDKDWIKDDRLGSAITDSSGHFRIDFCSEDFKQTFLSPLINVETPLTALPGPGVYFKIMANDGSIIYEEAPSYGKLPERKNIANCYHIKLFVDANDTDGPVGDMK